MRASLLKPAELSLHVLNAVRRTLYRRGVLSSRRLHRPVISVGARSFGGAGKTPATIAIAKELLSRGSRVVILSRGFGRSGAGGEVTEADPARFGDEPVLIWTSVPGARVVVGSDRFAAGRSLDCDVFLLDDGFQHLQLHRDFNLVIEDPDARWYREGPSSLADATLVVERRLKVQLPPALCNKKVCAFAGLANNQRFFAQLRGTGCDVVAVRAFPDHHRYTKRDITSLRLLAERSAADAIVTTEKDWVKIATIRATEEDLPFVAVSAEFVFAREELDALAGAVRR